MDRDDRVIPVRVVSLWFRITPDIMCDLELDCLLEHLQPDVYVKGS